MEVRTHNEIIIIVIIINYYTYVIHPIVGGVILYILAITFTCTLHCTTFMNLKIFCTYHGVHVHCIAY